MKQPSKIKLLTVAQTFYLEGRGVVVMPLISDYSGPMSFPVVLRRPGGEESVVQADLDIPRVIPRPQHYSFACCLRGVKKQDVPIGSEIWRHDD